MGTNAPTKPYLASLDSDTTTVSDIIAWSRYLGRTFGTAGSLCSLRYYERLDWITTDVREELERYLRGLSLDELHNKKYDEPGTTTPPLESLSGTPFGVHARSLEFIANIAGDDLEGDLLRAQLAEHHVEGLDNEQTVAMADGAGRT